LSVAEFREMVRQNVAALNRALGGLSAERVRIRACWGAGERRLVQSIPLDTIVDLLLKARVGALSIVGANGRHAYEWQVWQHTRLADGMQPVPGVVDNTTNIIEHPELVAERLLRYVGAVVKDRVDCGLGVDCGFATGAESTQVDERVAWAKLESLVAGARLASDALWASAWRAPSIDFRGAFR
jgi:5-methyltetrahydropteroyltriglutamate--homocysteine methyltransferase